MGCTGYARINAASPAARSTRTRRPGLPAYRCKGFCPRCMGLSSPPVLTVRLACRCLRARREVPFYRAGRIHRGRANQRRPAAAHSTARQAALQAGARRFPPARSAAPPWSGTLACLRSPAAISLPPPAGACTTEVTAVLAWGVAAPRAKQEARGRSPPGCAPRAALRRASRGAPLAAACGAFAPGRRRPARQAAGRSCLWPSAQLRKRTAGARTRRARPSAQPSRQPKPAVTPHAQSRACHGGCMHRLNHTGGAKRPPETPRPPAAGVRALSTCGRPCPPRPAAPPRSDPCPSRQGARRSAAGLSAHGFDTARARRAKVFFARPGRGGRRATLRRCRADWRKLRQIGPAAVRAPARPSPRAGSPAAPQEESRGPPARTTSGGTEASKQGGTSPPLGPPGRAPKRAPPPRRAPSGSAACGAPMAPRPVPVLQAVPAPGPAPRPVSRPARRLSDQRRQPRFAPQARPAQAGRRLTPQIRSRSLPKSPRRAVRPAPLPTQPTSGPGKASRHKQARGARRPPWTPARPAYCGARADAARLSSVSGHGRGRHRPGGSGTLLHTVT